MEITLCKDKKWLYTGEAFEIYKDCMYFPNYDGYKEKMGVMAADPAISIYLCRKAEEKVGILSLRRIDNGGAEIEGIAVLAGSRGSGIGKYMFQEAMEREKLTWITAETDEDAVDFYRKCGFQVTELGAIYGAGKRLRYCCSLER